MTSKFKKITALAFGLLMVVSLISVAEITIAKEKDDLTDTHALGPYDQFACNGAEEDELDTGDPNNSFFPPWDMSFKDVHTNNKGSFNGQFNFPFTDDEVFQKFNRENDAATTPTVVVTVAPEEVKKDQQVSVVAGLADFADTGLSDSKSFAASYSVNDLPLNGVQAGAKSLPESASGICGIVTRTPQTDADNDGMDDDWEKLHGLNPADPSDALQDPDQDSASDFFTNALGEQLIISPATAGGESGVMTNLAEYIWGTDPQNSDTDKDNITDGEEIIGFGGPTVTFTNKEPAGAELDLRVFAVGTSQKRDASQENANIIKLDSTTKTVFVSNGEHLRGELISAQKIVLPGQIERLEANFVGTKSEPESFKYTYVVDGKEVKNPLPGKHVLDVPIEDNIMPGTIIPVEIQAVNPSTGQLTVMKHDIQVGEKIVLEPSTPELTASAPYTVKALLVSGHAPSDFLFEWYIDGRLDEQASGVGKDTIALVAPEASGSVTNINLKLFEKQTSQLIGQELMELKVIPPSVEVKFVPEKPVEGDSVSAIATAKGFPLNLDTDQDGEFDATLLNFNWQLDAEPLPEDKNAALLSTISFKAGKTGDQHQVAIKVTAAGGPSASAEDSAQFSTADKSKTTTFDHRGASALARLIGLPAAIISVMPKHIFIVGLFVIVLAIILIGVKVFGHRSRRGGKAASTISAVEAKAPGQETKSGGGHA